MAGEADVGGSREEMLVPVVGGLGASLLAVLAERDAAP